MKVMISIDGASKGNGTASCRAAGGVFVKADGAEPYKVCDYIGNATNQRGEMLGLILALTEAHKFIVDGVEDIYIITDSEYLFNAVTKEWYKNWPRKGWITSTGEPVKNQDLWLKIIEIIDSCEEHLNVYHIKGHVIPFGKVTGANLLAVDPSGSLLYSEIALKFEKEEDQRRDKINHAIELFERNHNMSPDYDIIKSFIIMNLTVDIIVTTFLDNVAKTESMLKKR